MCTITVHTKWKRNENNNKDDPKNQLLAVTPKQGFHLALINK